MCRILMMLTRRCVYVSLSPTSLVYTYATCKSTWRRRKGLLVSGCGGLTPSAQGGGDMGGAEMMVVRDCVERMVVKGEPGVLIGKVDGLVVASVLCEVLMELEEGKGGCDVKGVVEALVWMRGHGVVFGGEDAGGSGNSRYGFFKYDRMDEMGVEYGVFPSSPVVEVCEEEDGVVSGDGESDGGLEKLYDMLMGMAFRAKDAESLDAVFDMAVRDGCCLSESSMVGKVAFLLKDYDAVKALEFYCVAVGRGWKIDPFSYKAIVTSLVAGAVDGKEYWDIAMKILHRFHMATPHHIDTNIHTIIIGICGRNGWFGEMMDLHGLMLQDSIEPSTITWNAFITACQKLQRPDVAFKFHHAMRSMGIPADVNTYSSLLSCAASMRDSSVAQSMWELMIQDGVKPDRIVCGAYIWALLEGGHPMDAANVFDEWVSVGVPPGWTPGGSRGVEYFSHVSKEYERERNWYMYRKCLRLNRLMRSKGIKPEVLSLVDVKVRAELNDSGYWIQAGRACEKFLQKHAEDLKPSIVAYSFAAIAHDRVGNRMRALELVGCFKHLRCIMNTSAEYATALNACSQLNALEPAVDLIKRAEKTGINLSIQCFTSSIKICSSTGDVECALWLLRKMSSFDLKPNQHTISCVLSLCGSANKVPGALKLFLSMEDRFGIKPDTVCFATIWDILGSSGAWKDACLFYIVAEKYHRDNNVTWLYSSLLPGEDPGEDPVCNVDMLRVLDLHMFSIVGAHIIVRLWLLLLQDAYRHGMLNDVDKYTFDIITGQGRHSVGGVSKLKPAVESLLAHGLGKSISLQTPRSNVGIIRVSLRDLIVLFDRKTSSSIGFDSIQDEEEVLALWKRAATTLNKAVDLLAELRSITH